jgi:hypothetical protein
MPRFACECVEEQVELSSNNTVYDLVTSVFDLLFIGSARMLFLSNSYNKSIYLYPQLEIDGKRPVRSVYVWPSISRMVT